MTHRVPHTRAPIVTGLLALGITACGSSGRSKGSPRGGSSSQSSSNNGGPGDPAQAGENPSSGVHTHVSLVDQSAMYAKYCGVPKQNIDAWPTVSWVRDFADPLTVLYVPFYGPAITPIDNSNLGEVKDPTINSAMHKAALVTDPTARAQAWGQRRQDAGQPTVAVCEDCDNEANVEGDDVAGVDQLWNTRTWDLDFTSLKNP